MANQINIKDGALARAWKSDVQNLNEETKMLLEDVGTALQEVKGDADSTIVDEIYKYGGQILGSANKILEGMNELVGMVNNLLDKLASVLDAGKNIVHTIVSKLV